MKNKKGFTLIELLAVIVILALLIVVVANTAIPAMNRARKNSLKVYAQRVQERAKEYAMAKNSGSTESYLISELMNESDQYEGYVTVSQDNGTYTATITIRDKKNDLLLSGLSSITDGTDPTTNANTTVDTSAATNLVSVEA